MSNEAHFPGNENQTVKVSGQDASPKVVLLLFNAAWFTENHNELWEQSALILTALLKDHFNFSVLDANGENLSEEEAMRRLQAIQPKVILLSATFMDFGRKYHAIAASIRAACPSAMIVLGGIYPTILGEKAAKDKNLDYIFMGHAEERVVAFLQQVLAGDKAALKSFDGIVFRDEQGKVHFNPIKSYIGNVEHLVKPDYSLIDIKKYTARETAHRHLKFKSPTARIITSYGCPHRCCFCAVPTIMGRKIANRPIEDVLEEIEFLMRDYGIRSFVFSDSNLFENRIRAKTLIHEFVHREYHFAWKAMNVSAWNLSDELLELMKQAGCKALEISVESGCPRVLKEIIHKPFSNVDFILKIIEKCKQLGISILGDFIFGLPGETWEEIRQTIRFAEQCDFDVASFSVATPYPKTELYEIVQQRGLFTKGFGSAYGYSAYWDKGFISTDEFLPFELEVLRVFEWDRINFSSPEKIARAGTALGCTAEEIAAMRKSARVRLASLYRREA